MSIAPNDTALLYSPKNWEVTASYARTICAGAYARFAYTGSSAVTLTFDVSKNATPLPFLRYRIDNQGWVDVALAASITIPVPSTTSWPAHEVEIVVRSTSEALTRWGDSTQTAVQLTGIDIGSGTLRPVARRPRTGIVFGDSITEGVRTLNSTIAPSGNDVTTAWSFQLRDLVGAEIGVIGFGAVGWDQAGSGGVPGLLTSYSKINAATARTFDGLDFVVVNMGTNNSGTQAMILAWIKEILGKLPSSCKLLVMRPFGGRLAAEISAAVAAAGDQRVSYVDTTGWFDPADSCDQVHPYGYPSIDTLGPKTASAISATLTGSKPSFYRRAADGTAAPVYTATKGA